MTQQHSRRYCILIALQTLLRKEIWRFLRIWSQTLLPPAITMSLYFIIFGKFIGSQLAPIQGFSYIQYIVPGLIIMAVITNSFSNTASSFFLTKFNRSIEEMLVSPMPVLIILLGFTLGGTLRGLCVGIIVFFIALLFTHVPIEHPLIVLLIAFFAASLFSMAGLINAIYAKRFDDIAFIPTFVLTPLTYLGGVFYSLQQLPAIWQTISLFNPILSIVNILRYGLLGITDTHLYLAFILIIALLGIMATWASMLLYKGIGIKA